MVGEAGFSFQSNDTILPDNCDPLVGYAKDETIPVSEEHQSFNMDDGEFVDLFCSVFGQENTTEKKAEIFGNYEQKPDSDTWIQNEDFMPGLEEFKENLQRSISELRKPVKEKPDLFSLASWELLNSYGRGFKMSREENLKDPIEETPLGGQKLSTEEILRVAGEKFIQFSTNRIDGISMFIHPYVGSSLSGLSMDEARDVELVHLLLSAAENVGTKRFDIASKLISRCLWVASDSGTPVQRVAFYFAEALQQRIYREEGWITGEKMRNQPEKRETCLALGTNNTFLAAFQELPFAQVMQLAAIQAIIENVKTSCKIHLIDLQVRSGIQWIALMQGLADCSIKHLKITAVVTTDVRKVEDTGKRLLSFAQSLNLPFIFKVFNLKDMKDFKEDLLDVEADETLVIYSFIMLRTMISTPYCLDNLMRAVTRLRPALMVVTEVEANHNSSSFVDRFIEALFFYSAFFDCLEDCMEKNNEFRTILEKTYFGDGIINIVSTEGQERVTRNVKLDVWRAFLVRFGMEEIELSESSRYQASLVLKQFSHGSSCTLENNGKGLFVGWKGTPLYSLTTWKFK
ncbi:DELLA protein RGL3-like [Primulina eburnea]|uniref:DELLA protein RGL3-like n=1 Tax=Primulina eburnea TaxID=1245227 RepID=UPI003C6C8161